MVLLVHPQLHQAHRALSGIFQMIRTNLALILTEMMVLILAKIIPYFFQELQEVYLLQLDFTEMKL